MSNKSFFLYIILLFSTNSYAHLDDHLIKAGFLEKFALFTEWPPESKFKDCSKPFIISVLGQDPIINDLEKIYKHYRINNKDVKIRTISKINEIEDSDILYLTESIKDNIPEIIKYTENLPIITVCDTENCAEIGCHIGFYITDKGTVHFKINVSKMKQAGLKMNVLVLDIAKIIK